MSESEAPKVKPACKYFEACGGCLNQHIAYEDQLENKRKRLAYLLQQQYSGKIKAYGEQAYNYRNRMDFIVSQATVGFRQHDERRLIDIDECPISEPRLNKLLAEVRAFLDRHPEIERFDRRTKMGVLRYAVVRVADTTSVSFVVNEDSTRLAGHMDILKLFADTTTADNVVVAYVPSATDDSTSLECFAMKGDEYLHATFCHKKIMYHSQAFFQNNTKMAEKMVLHVKELLKEYNAHERTLVDAYGGVGTFGIVLASSAKNVISIESHPLGTEACKKNIEINHVENMTAINEDAGNLKKLNIPPKSIILLDPPRSGLGDKMMRYLLEMRPNTIIYVSCNPSQLAKELQQLGKHYRIDKADLFDLFPQTNHMEAVVVLSKVIPQ